MKKSCALLLVCVALLTFPAATAQQNGNSEGHRRDQEAKFRRHGDNRLANQYIIVLDEDATGPEADHAAAAARAEQILLRTRGGRLKDVYAAALSGFSAEMSEEDAIALSQDPEVLYVEEDSVMHTTATQANAPWGLDR